MTDQNAAAPPGAVSTGSLHQSLAAVREAHLVLRRALADVADPLEREQRIRDFLTGAAKAGAFIEDPKERRVAQGILDFWGAELAAFPQAQTRDYTTLMLAPFDATATSSPQGDQPTQNLDEQRALIRLAALARQWRDSGKRPGYLLYGDAVKEAARFADRDANLAEFVTASRDAVSGRRKMWFGSAAAFVVAALIVAAGFYHWQFSYLPTGRDQAIRELKVHETATPARQAETLRWLSDRQLWLPPYDFSGAVDMKHVRVPGLRMWAANFSRVNFDDVEFPNANLNAVSFSGSEFSFDGNGGRNNFSNAVLWRALFRNARIRSTSFAGADLYRAIFDRAILCDVDFAGASLRSASFWAVTLDPKTEENLKNVAWWQAVGWPWSEILKLAVPHPKNVDVAVVNQEDEARNARLKQSRGFQEDMRDPKDNLARAAPGSLDRVLALNDMAWTLAIWGVDIAGPKSPSDPCTATGIPENGLQAAEQAVCILTKLNGEGDKKGVYKDLLSNLRDTLAYIQMQRGEMDATIQTLQEMGKDDPAALETSESTQFRYAIAQYAVAGNDQDKAAAIKRFTTAVSKYQPSHEVQTLRDYIFPVKEFVDVLKASSNRTWPEVENQATCQPLKPAGAH
jgi:hypothetical protein